jgi:hypothetical protein
MKATQKVLTQLCAFSAGVILTSLWITNTETYKIFIPIFFIILVIKLVIYDSCTK